MELHPVAVPRQRHIGRMAVHAGGRQHMRAIDRHALRFMDGGGIAVIDMGIIFQVKRDRSAIVQLHRHALRRYLLDLPQRAVLTPSPRSFFRNMMRSPVAKSRAPRSADTRTSGPSSPASRSRSRAARFKSRTSALVWVRMIRD